MPVQTPFADLTFSSTSIADDSVLARIKSAIKGMGGLYLHNLVKNTNCLIVGARWSEKYNFAVQHRPDIKLYTPEFILSLHERWLVGEELNYAEELEKGVLKVFSGLRICITHAADRDRKIYENLVVTAEGYFTNTLTSDINILVSPLLSGKKVEYAKKWHIKVVHPTWITDSIKFKFAIDPVLYLTELSEDKRGLPNDSRPASTEIPVSSATSLIPTANVGLTVRAQRRKDSEQWGNFFAPMPKRQATARDASPPLGLAVSSSIQATDSASTSFNALVPGMFSGTSFAFAGFDEHQQNILKRALISHQGTLHLDNPDYLIVNSKKPSAGQDHSCAGTAAIITEWAIERSLHKKTRLLNDIWATPVYTQDIPDFHGISICLSGYSGVEVLHLGRLIGILGAQYLETMTVDREVLVANSPSAKKVIYAKEWGIPVVNEKWLWDCAKEGKLLDLRATHVIDGLGPRQAPTKRASSQTAATGIKTEDKPSVTSIDSISFDDTPSQISYVDETAAEKSKILAALGEDTEQNAATRSFVDDQPTRPAVNVKRVRRT